jgi:hypothetical protein
MAQLATPAVAQGTQFRHPHSPGGTPYPNWYPSTQVRQVEASVQVLQVVGQAEQPEGVRKNPAGSQAVQERTEAVMRQVVQAGKVCWQEMQVLVRVLR